MHCSGSQWPLRPIQESQASERVRGSRICTQCSLPFFRGLDREKESKPFFVAGAGPFYLENLQFGACCEVAIEPDLHSEWVRLRLEGDFRWNVLDPSPICIPCYSLQAAHCSERERERELVLGHKEIVNIQGLLMILIAKTFVLFRVNNAIAAILPIRLRMPSYALVYIVRTRSIQ